MSVNRRVGVLTLTLLLAGCASSPLSGTFTPRSDYPQDPWVKGYAQESDCLGGEKLAAISLDMPIYPTRAFKSGLQGWTIVRLDVDASGNTRNVLIDRAVPSGGLFSKPSRKAVNNWTFSPPTDGPLTACRVLIRYRLGGVSLGG